MHMYYHIFLAPLLGLSHAVGAFKAAFVPNSGPASAEVYTENAICRQNNCVNPLFPGLNDLAQLEQLVWQASAHSNVAGFLNFCQGAITYDPALPSPNTSSVLLSSTVSAQDDAAATMFFYHLSAMGYEAWEHKRPGQDRDQCVKAVWKMVCFTYFPKKDAGARVGEPSTYRRPCSGPCHDYLQKCNVECCDESPRCVFNHTPAGASLLQTGYVDDAGPSALCTGSNGPRGARLPFALLLGIFGFHLAIGSTSGDDAPSSPVKKNARQRKVRPDIGRCSFFIALIACALSLYGCDVDVQRHYVGNWRQNSDYLVKYEFIQPDQPPSTAVLNSCSVQGIAPTLQCSGHGYCKEWSTRSSSAEPVSFCVCNKGWADPECRTPRQSQIVAFVLSLFGGFLGLDYFYLGFPVWGIVKLFTLGGAGLWWLLDIVRTGAGPVYTATYRVNNDLPHWVFVLVTITLFLVIGFFIAIESYLSHRRQKRNKLQLLKESEEARHLGHNAADLAGPRYVLPPRPGPPRGFEHGPDFHGYGAALPSNLPNAGVPYAAGFQYSG